MSVQSQMQDGEDAHTQSQSQSQGGLPSLADYAVAAGYSAPSFAWDELHDGHALRPHWTRVLKHFDALGPTGLAKRWDEARRLFRDNGVGHTAYAQGKDRPWELSPFPLVLESAEWNTIASGVTQRARLVEAALADLHGDQRLIHEGFIPAAAVLANPAFQRPCHGYQPAGGRWLTLYAADVMRDASGTWRLLNDGTRSAVNLGFALENRIVLSRILPEAYRGGQVRRLAGFFLTVREMLQSLAPQHRDNPRLALLTPGPGSETYFEHAFLARYLGYTLVEGADLTVRADGVHLKTLGGLHPVDVLLRRLDDAWCDSLELRGDSLLGVPGLMHAARSGQVAIANPLGSGLADGCLLLANATAICQRLLGEDPQIMPVGITWAGHTDMQALGPDALLRAFHANVPGLGLAPLPFGRLAPDKRAAFDQCIARAPHAVAVQQLPPPATTPVWSDGRLQPRPVVLRVFACATADGWSVMPGALARVADSGDVATMYASRGGLCQDVWICADTPVPEVSLLRPAGAPVELKRGGADLPSRVADNLYWFGRYGERAEDLCRLLRAALARVGDIPESVGGREAAALTKVLAQLGHLKPLTGMPLDRQLIALVADPSHPSGLPAVISHLHSSAFAVRDRLSNDTWRIVSQLHDEAADAEIDLDPGEATNRINHLVMALAALAGMASENTTRGPGWRFLDLGRRLERTQFTCDLLRATIAEPRGDDSLEVMLEVADSAITYRSRYLTSLQAPAALDLLLTDDTNPRAAAFLLATVEKHVANLPRAAEQALPTEAERLAVGARTWLRVVDPFALCRRDETGARAELAHVLEHLSADLDRLSDAVTIRYLTHAKPSRQLGSA